MDGCRKHKNLASEADLIRAFTTFDQNGDGSIDAEEFMAAMCYLGISKNFIEIDREQAQAAFKAYDSNNDGKISLEGNYFKFLSLLKYG